MTNEMDAMRMDERQREAWLRANRLTLMLVGLVWLGMIGWQLGHGTTPWFLIVMVPVFGVFRFLTYLHYQRIG
jgi:F0F1-type ATP synthase assembly protein I